MTKNKLFSILATVLASILMVFALVYYNFIVKDEKVDLSVGLACPEFTVDTYKIEDGKFTLGGEPFNPTAQRGKVLVINFWATWCAPCKAELSEFDQLQKAYSDDVVVITLNGEARTAENLAKWLNEGASNDSTPVENKWNEFSILFGKYDTAVQDLYQMLGFSSGALPATMIVGRNGAIAFITEGSMHYDDLVREVLPLI